MRLEPSVLPTMAGVKDGRGALCLAVYRGKMSEGLVRRKWIAAVAKGALLYIIYDIYCIPYLIPIIICWFCQHTPGRYPRLPLSPSKAKTFLHTVGKGTGVSFRHFWFRSFFSKQANSKQPAAIDTHFEPQSFGKRVNDTGMFFRRFKIFKVII